MLYPDGSTRRLALAALPALGSSRRGDPYSDLRPSRRSAATPYTSETYRKALDEAGLRGSMSAIGNPYHNAQAESFMKTLKVEDIYVAGYESFPDVAKTVAEVHRAGLATRGAALSPWLPNAGRI